MGIQEQTHQHDEESPALAVETCPLCGSKISRGEFLRVQERIRTEVQSQAQEEIARISALKDQELETAVAERDAVVREQFAEQAARETADALRKQRDNIEQLHMQEIATRDEKRERLEARISELQGHAVEAQQKEGKERKNAAEKLAALTEERDRALVAARTLEAGLAEARVAIEAKVLQKYEGRVRELQEAIELAKVERVSYEAALQASKEELEQQKKDAQEAKTAEVLQLRESLEKGQKLALYENEQEHTRERERWQKKFADLERQLQHKTSNDLGDATQFHVLDALRNAYPEDRITAIAKGKQGADIRHEVVHKGNTCGKILIDAKNHEGWRYAFVTKLKEDQRAEHADYAILATAEFPSGKKVLCVEEDVIVTGPAQIVSVVGIVRRWLVLMHGLRLTAVEREKKTQQVYEFITSEKFRQQLGRVEEVAAKLGELDVDEQQAHQRVWKKRGQLVVSLNDAHAKIEAEISAIIEE